jgi:hypothetical protein
MEQYKCDGKGCHVMLSAPHDYKTCWYHRMEAALIKKIRQTDILQTGYNDLVHLLNLIQTHWKQSPNDFVAWWSTQTEYHNNEALRKIKSSRLDRSKSKTRSRSTSKSARRRRLHRTLSDEAGIDYEFPHDRSEYGLESGFDFGLRPLSPNSSSLDSFSQGFSQCSPPITLIPSTSSLIQRSSSPELSQKNSRSRQGKQQQQQQQQGSMLIQQQGPTMTQMSESTKHIQKESSSITRKTFHVEQCGAITEIAHTTSNSIETTYEVKAAFTTWTRRIERQFCNVSSIETDDITSPWLRNQALEDESSQEESSHLENNLITFIQDCEEHWENLRSSVSSIDHHKNLQAIIKILSQNVQYGLELGNCLRIVDQIKQRHQKFVLPEQSSLSQEDQASIDEFKIPILIRQWQDLKRIYPTIILTTKYSDEMMERMITTACNFLDGKFAGLLALELSAQISHLIVWEHYLAPKSMQIKSHSIRSCYHGHNKFALDSLHCKVPESNDAHQNFWCLVNIMLMDDSTYTICILHKLYLKGFGSTALRWSQVNFPKIYTQWRCTPTLGTENVLVDYIDEYEKPKSKRAKKSDDNKRWIPMDVLSTEVEFSNLHGKFQAIHKARKEELHQWSQFSVDQLSQYIDDERMKRFPQLQQHNIITPNLELDKMVRQTQGSMKISRFSLYHKVNDHPRLISHPPPQPAPLISSLPLSSGSVKIPASSSSSSLPLSSLLPLSSRSMTIVAPSLSSSLSNSITVSPSLPTLPSSLKSITSTISPESLISNKQTSHKERWKTLLEQVKEHHNHKPLECEGISGSLQSNDNNFAGPGPRRSGRKAQYIIRYGNQF